MSFHPWEFLYFQQKSVFLRPGQPSYEGKWRWKQSCLTACTGFLHFDLVMTVLSLGWQLLSHTLFHMTHPMLDPQKEMVTLSDSTPVPESFSHFREWWVKTLQLLPVYQGPWLPFPFLPEPYPTSGDLCKKNHKVLWRREYHEIFILIMIFLKKTLRFRKVVFLINKTHTHKLFCYFCWLIEHNLVHSFVHSSRRHTGYAVLDDMS